jgi:hypothetical protein
LGKAPQFIHQIVHFSLSLSLCVHGNIYTAITGVAQIRFLCASSLKESLIRFLRAKLEDSHKNSYEIKQLYEFQFADGKTRRFDVVGMEE